MGTEKATPVRRQYLEIKRQHPEALLFFRLGDFYETFDDDAEIAARELDIVLTSRNVAKGTRVPMAGIPHHALESYLGRLIERGYHVAICEQIGDGPVKGLFPREVVRIVTPGTVFEPGLLPPDANNYLAAVVAGEAAVGIAYVDVSTGEFAATQVEAADPIGAARHELQRLAPAEVLLADSLALEGDEVGRATRLPDWRFEMDRAEAKLKAHFGAATLDGFGLGDRPLARRAAGALVDYLVETGQPAVGLLTSLSSYSLSDFMALDEATRRNLELTERMRGEGPQGTLLGVLDHTLTPMGKRTLRQWIGKPLLDKNRIEARLNLVQALFEDGMWRAEVRASMQRLGDLERLANRAAAGVAVPRDLTALRGVLGRLPGVRAQLEGHEVEEVTQLWERLDPCEEAHALLSRAIADDPPVTFAQMGVIREGYSERLDEILSSTQRAREWIANLEPGERERTGIKSLKVGYNKVFGYYIEVTKANVKLVPDDYIRKQTLVNAERYITPELKDVEATVLTAEERIRALEHELFHEVCRQVSEHTPRLLGSAQALARLDVTASLAEVAARKGYVRPELSEDNALDVHDGRHPVVEEHLEGSRFVPNDAVFEEGEHIRVITGPNMSGKSTYLRQVAVITLMAQMGSYVPATSARLGLTDRIFTRIGAQDEISAGQSTFMVEMVETANILHNATSRSLLILDEIGRGTSTYDGLSIAWAVVEYLHNHPRLRARTLFATHYHELTRLAEVLPGVRNYNVDVSEEDGQVVFLHRIVPGGADKSYGIHVAQLAGMPRAVVHRAEEILAQLESERAEPGGPASPAPHQLRLFPEANPLLQELRSLDVNSLSPLEALNRLFEWRRKFAGEDEDTASS